MGRGCSRGNTQFFMSFNFLKAKRNHKNKTELLFTKDLNKTIFSEDQKILLTGTIKELKFLLLWNHRFFIRHFWSTFEFNFHIRNSSNSSVDQYFWPMIFPPTVYACLDIPPFLSYVLSFFTIRVRPLVLFGMDLFLPTDWYQHQNARTLLGLMAFLDILLVKGPSLILWKLTKTVKSVTQLGIKSKGVSIQQSLPTSEGSPNIFIWE